MGLASFNRFRNLKAAREGVEKSVTHDTGKNTVETIVEELKGGYLRDTEQLRREAQGGEVVGDKGKAFVEVGAEDLFAQPLAVKRFASNLRELATQGERKAKEKTPASVVVDRSDDGKVRYERAIPVDRPHDYGALHFSPPSSIAGGSEDIQPEVGRLEPPDTSAANMEDEADDVNVPAPNAHGDHDEGTEEEIRAKAIGVSYVAQDRREKEAKDTGYPIKSHAAEELKRLETKADRQDKGEQVGPASPGDPTYVDPEELAQQRPTTTEEDLEGKPVQKLVDRAEEQGGGVSGEGEGKRKRSGRSRARRAKKQE